MPAFAESEREVSLGASTFVYSSYLRTSTQYWAAEAAYHQPVGAGFWSHVRFGGGLRASTRNPYTNLPLEGFIQAELVAQVGPWMPAIGPEVGLSGFARFHPTISDELQTVEDARFGPWYLAFSASPLQFRFSWLSVSALEFHVGSHLGVPLGPAVRLQLNLLRVGVSL